MDQGKGPPIPKNGFNPSHKGKKKALSLLEARVELFTFSGGLGVFIFLARTLAEGEEESTQMEKQATPLNIKEVGGHL